MDTGRLPAEGGLAVGAAVAANGVGRASEVGAVSVGITNGCEGTDRTGQFWTLLDG